MNTIVEGAAGTHRRLYPLFMRTPPTPGWQNSPPRRHLWQLTRSRRALCTGAGVARPEVCICPDNGSLSISQVMLSICLGCLVFLNEILLSFHTHTALAWSSSPGSQVSVAFPWCLLTPSKTSSHLRHAVTFSRLGNCFIDGAIYHQKDSTLELDENVVCSKFQGIA